jgi:hypothetical protein
MISSVIRWAVIDSIHHSTGLVRPRWSDEKLHERLGAYEWLIENHYRYYQCYANLLISLCLAYGCWRASPDNLLTEMGWLDSSIVILAGILFAGSRNALNRYYRRAEALLGYPMETLIMTNGGHHPPEPSGGKPIKAGSSTSKPKSSKSPTAKSPKTDRPNKS